MIPCALALLLFLRDIKQPLCLTWSELNNWHTYTHTHTCEQAPLLRRGKLSVGGHKSLSKRWKCVQNTLLHFKWKHELHIYSNALNSKMFNCKIHSSLFPWMKRQHISYHFTYLVDRITKSKLKFIIAILVHICICNVSFFLDWIAKCCTGSWQKGGLWFFHFQIQLATLQGQTFYRHHLVFWKI